MRYALFSQAGTPSKLVCINPLQVLSFIPGPDDEGTTILLSAQNSGGGLFGYTVIEGFSEVRTALERAAAPPPPPARPV